jgi:hypothetical protein
VDSIHLHKVSIINNLKEKYELPVSFPANSRLFPTEGDERKILRSKVPAKIVRILCSQIRQCPFGEGCELTKLEFFRDSCAHGAQ